ncbi:hypothetical protein FMEXI_4199 [Fusarium mexicanum]|uniref:Uncharacterized protein n=1 Tax=Fusarium mexicanum TaxID=751941 RepID=A0A8H5J625_9HYPO|nr:hypothetical protein FMEXI_4199 [Fusarium mexicanum]
MRYRLSPEELKSVQLIDYVTNEELTGDWTYSTTRNEFSHSISSMPVADSAQSPETAQNAAFDNKRDTIQFWISTTEIASKEIAASITSSEGIKSSTNDSHN